MRIVHTADIHLTGTGDKRWEALGAVLEVAGDAAAPAGAVVIAGDLFDHHAGAQELKTALRTRFDKAGVPVLILPGNHDRRGLRAGDFYGERVTLLAGETPVADVADVRFVGLPFADGGADRTVERLHEAAAGRREGAVNVLVFHGELLDLVPGGGAFGDEGGEYMPVRLAAFDDLGFDYVLAGHFHRDFSPQAYRGGYFVYPGSPVSITSRELGRRHVCIVETGSPPRPQPLDTFHFARVDVRLDPFDGRSPLDAVETRLAAAHPAAEILLRVGGFFDRKREGMTEEELAGAVRALIERYRVRERDYEEDFRDVGEVLDHELYRRFRKALDGGAIGGDLRREVDEMVIRSLMELVDAH